MVTNTWRIKAHYRHSWIIAACALVIAGFAYRQARSHLHRVTSQPVELPIALSELPSEIGNWEGQDIAIPDDVIRIAGNDDYIYRLYKQEPTDRWVNLYIAYSGRPRTMIGHRPEVCYVGAGWVCEETVRSNFQLNEFQTAPCLIHRFYKPGSDGVQLVVLNYYIMNGVITNSESGFTGLGWRTPNIKGDPAHYVAQVQISSVLESQVRLAAENMTKLICDYLPDEKGNVKAAEQTDFSTVTFGAASKSY